MSAGKSESFKPVPLAAPAVSTLKFKLRCLVDLQLATIVRFLKPAMAGLPLGTILDVGAGRARWRGWLPPGSRYQGVDIAEAGECDMSARQDIVLYDGTTIPFADGSFDGAICIEVLEHAEHPERLLRETARTLKPGATLLLTVPWSARRHHIPHDYHRFTRERLQSMLRAAGFIDIDIAERGDDIAAIANKFVVVTIRLFTSISLRNFLVNVPLTVVFGGIGVLMLLAARVSPALGFGAPEDPLGYACRARKG